MKSLTLGLVAVSLPLMLGPAAPAAFSSDKSSSKDRAADVHADGDAAATLHLSNGDYLAGELRGSVEAGILRWQGSAFAAPLDFPLGSVSTVSFPAHPGAGRPRPDSPYCLELEGGDVLFGSLMGLTDKECLFDAAGLGPLHIQRSAIQRIVRSHGAADLVYLGPNGLLEWKQSPPGAWQQDAGRISTSHNGASLLGDLGLPKRACIDFEFSWTSDPDFTWVLGANTASAPETTVTRNGARIRVVGAGANNPPDDSPFRVEVFAGHLVLVCETPQKADLVPLQKIAPGAGRCHFRIYLDQDKNRAIVFAADGKPLADLTVADAPSPSAASPMKTGGLGAIVAAFAGTTSPPRAGTCLRLVNHHGDVRLEQLSITRWNPGAPGPTAMQGDKSRLVRSDGSVLGGEIQGFDAATKEFLVAEGGRTARVPADAVECIMLPSSGRPSAFEVRTMCDNGVRLSGKLRKVDDGRLWLSRPGITEPLAIKLSSLHSLVVLENRKPLPEPSGRSGLLEGDGLRLHGRLVETNGASARSEGTQLPAASCLAWRPRGGASSSPLKREFSGRIVYHEASPRQSAQSNQSGQPQALVAAPAGGVLMLGAVVNVLGGETRVRTQSPLAPWKGPALYLRTGDTIQCKVERIDERGVTFHSPRFDATFVPNDKIKAVELENRSRATKIDISKRDRLLTLPRMEKDDPPTHLIRSIDGDYLRGRLVELNDKTLTVEVREDSRRVDRDQVASIIWLDKSEKNGKTDSPKNKAAGNTPAAAAKTSLDNRVQSLGRDGVRMTFRPEKLTGTILQGTSDVLGACRVELGDVDQLIIGRSIEQDAMLLPYQRWTLQPAIEPKFAQGNPGGGAGLESELVGKLAPDFELETLDGPRFRLSDQRKKIVVVDFWATWCGPCRQTLPELVRAVDKFRDRNVVLLTVNLQETPEAIKAMMALQGWKMPVGLDHNGAVAEKYASVAIPQTVIIDGNGNVARLFVGGGPQYFDELSAALQALVTPAAGQGKPE